MVVYNKIINLLDSLDQKYVSRTHEATYTSEQSAETRGESLSSGAKAIVYKIQDEYYLFVMAADQRIDPKKIKTHFKHEGKRAKKTRFASVEELKRLTGLVPGSVPPFGPPVLPFHLYVDPSLLQNEYISFNAGSLEHSITIKLKDYIDAAKPEIFEFIQS